MPRCCRPPPRAPTPPRPPARRYALHPCGELLATFYEGGKIKSYEHALEEQPPTMLEQAMTGLGLGE